MFGNRQIKPDEVIKDSVALTDKWKLRLDELAKPRVLVWNKKSIVAEPASKLLAVSPDGTHVLMAGQQMQVVDIANSKSISIETKAKTLAPAFLGNNNLSLIAFDGECLKRWDLNSGKMVEKFDAINQAPIASCQSSDGQRILLLADAKQLYVIDLKSNELQRMRFGNDSQLAERPALWCSANGDRYIARAGKSLQVFAWDKANSSYKAATRR